MDITTVLGYETFTIVEKLDKGWSDDVKYYIETNKNDKLLLRLSDIDKYEHKKYEYEMMRECSNQGIVMQEPLGFGVCNDDKNVYILMRWCEGDSANEVLSNYSLEKQYELGINAGVMLKKIHLLSAPENSENWSVSFRRKSNNKIRQYLDCNIRFENDGKIISFIKENSYLLEDRHSTFQHGDYHVGNMVISKDNQLSVIDFNRISYGDPWEEFNRVVWSAEVSPYFASGQINGYFTGEPPIEFFKLLALYISVNTLSSIPWAVKFGEEQINIMLKQAQDVLRWFDNMSNPIPTWYKKTYESITL